MMIKVMLTLALLSLAAWAQSPLLYTERDGTQLRVWWTQPADGTWKMQWSHDLKTWGNFGNETRFADGLAMSETKLGKEPTLYFRLLRITNALVSCPVNTNSNPGLGRPDHWTRPGKQPYE